MTRAKTIEYFFSAHSAYAYLGAWELDRIATQASAEVIYRPFDFAPVLAASGGKGFRERPAAHLAYFFGREMQRWAEWRGLPILAHRPQYHDNPLDLANGAIIAAGDQAGPLSRAILRAHWRDDADHADPATIATLAEDLGINGPTLIEASQSAAIQAQLAENTQEAIARSVFGSPTYFVDGDMFYGQDRLMMVERALQKPFAT